MYKNWQKILLKDLVEFNPKESLPKDFKAKKIPMGNLKEYEKKIKGYEIEEYKSGPKFRNGDTLVAKITPCLENGKTAFVDILEESEVGYGSSEFIVLRANKCSDPNFIYYLARSPFFREKAITCMEGTSGRKRVNETALKNQGFLVPDLSTQQKIASVLSALDDKIELNNKINEELETMAKMLYDYWFVQFDFPNADGKPYKSSGGKMVFNKKLKREIPEGWEVIRFDKLIERTKTGDWGKEKPQGNYQERVFCIRGADINGVNGEENIDAPERFILGKNLSKALEPGDFIIEISGGSPTQSTARIALLTEKAFERFDTNVVCTNFCKAVTLNNPMLIYNFFREWQKLYGEGIFFNFEGKTTGIKNFMFDSFTKSYHIVIPQKEILNKFYNFSRIIENKKHTNLKENQELASLRDWLLPMLMNGQVSVGAAQEVNFESLARAAEDEVKYGNGK